MKKGKELRVNSFKNYNVYYGSVNNKEPKALYVNISAWAEPENDESLNYNRIIRDLDKKIRQSIYIELNEPTSIFVKERTILDFDIKESGIKFGKKSFTNCEITLFMKQAFLINSDNVKLNVDKLIKTIINNILEKSENFKFYKKKK